MLSEFRPRGIRRQSARNAPSPTGRRLFLNSRTAAAQFSKRDTFLRTRVPFPYRSQLAFVPHSTGKDSRFLTLMPWTCEAQPPSRTADGSTVVADVPGGEAGSNRERWGAGNGYVKFIFTSVPWL